MIKGSFEALYERKCGTPWYLLVWLMS